ncbi:MAG: hypothetical protein Ct9H300mP28_20860 [Pseudomonadota bacterium]|nr:MAG: hypothetical protein Ct9H300mP28_20860 [Pseudomonadota bacterium]
MEHQVAMDSGSCVVASRSGFVDNVDPGAEWLYRRMLILPVKTKFVPANVDIYHLIKYRRSNQNTCINQRPIVKIGDRIEAGDVIADGSCTENGELAFWSEHQHCFYAMAWIQL